MALASDRMLQVNHLDFTGRLLVKANAGLDNQGVTSRESTGTKFHRARMMIGIVSIWLAGVAFGITSTTSQRYPQILDPARKDQARLSRIECPAGGQIILDEAGNIGACLSTWTEIYPTKKLARNR